MNNLVSPDLIILGWITIILYAAITIFIVIKNAIKIKNINDYAVGNVNFNPVFVGLALAASMTSAATFIINPGFIAYYGFSGVLSYGIVMPIASMTSLYFLSKGFRKHGSTVKATTMAQWMGSRYQSKGYGLFFAFLSLLLITFIVLIAVGLAKVLGSVLNVPEYYILIGEVIFIFGYMMYGGANSMVYTNTVQALLMLVVAFILLGSGYEHFANGVNGFIDKLYAIDPKLTALTNDSSFLFRDYFEIIVTQIIIGVAIICQPHLITKSLLLKNEKDVNRYLTVGITVQMIFFFVVFVGLYARLTFPDLMIGSKPIGVDNMIPSYVVQHFPPFVGLIVVLGLISAGISTLEGLIQSIASTTTSDIIKPLFGKFLPVDEEKKNKSLMLINKLAIAVFGVITILLSYRQIMNPKLSVGIFAQNGVYAYFSAAFVPILFGMFLKDAPKQSVIASSITAVIVHFSFYYGKIAVPLTKATGENPGVAASMAIVASIIVGLITYLIYPKNNEHK